MKKLHIRKCQKQPGWELMDFSKSKKGEQLLWAQKKSVLVAISSGYCKDAASNSDPISLLIHGSDGQFKDERTFPKSADPKRSKG